MKKLLVIGGGGHAKVVIDLARVSGLWSISGVLDDSPEMLGKEVLGCKVIGRTDQLQRFSGSGISAIVAVGSNGARERLYAMARDSGADMPALVHPAATIASSARLGAGTVVMAGAVVNAASIIGEGVIVNTGAVIDHDCRIGDFCHIGPGVALCGSVSVGIRSLIGVGVSAIPGVSIGRDCILGAGAAVVCDIASGSRAIGVPARVVQ